MALYFMEDTNTIAFPAVERKAVKKNQMRIIMCSEVRSLSSGKGSMVLLEMLAVRIIVGEINPFGFPILVVASIENCKVIGNGMKSMTGTRNTSMEREQISNSCCRYLFLIFSLSHANPE